MAKKTYRFAKQIAIHDPSKDIPREYNQNGRITRMGNIGLRYVAPGEPVELEKAEGDALIAKVGEYKGPAAAPGGISISSSVAS